MSSRPRHSINQLERDRILFQRQKFPELFKPANISQNSTGLNNSPLPNVSSSFAYPTSPYETSVYYCRDSRRQSSFNKYLYFLIFLIKQVKFICQKNF